MKGLKEYNIQFVGLAEGQHSFQYSIDNKFFEVFDFNDFNSSNIQVDVLLIKKTTLLELKFDISGSVNVDCDTSLEPFDLKINGTHKLIVKFGPEFNDENDEILVLPHEEYQLNVAQYIYEFIVLSVPIKKVHPKVADGTLETEALKRLKELEIKKNTAEDNTADPRWDKLKNLITEKKT